MVPRTWANAPVQVAFSYLCLGRGGAMGPGTAARTAGALGNLGNLARREWSWWADAIRAAAKPRPPGGLICALRSLWWLRNGALPRTRYLAVCTVVGPVHPNSGPSHPMWGPKGAGESPSPRGTLSART